jgi:hypothetical protein
VTNPEVLEAIVRPVFNRAFAEGGGGSVKLRFGHDHDGEPAVFVDLKIDGDGISLPDDFIERNQKFVFEVRNALKNAGEERYIYILTDFRYQEETIEDGARRKRGRAR